MQKQKLILLGCGGTGGHVQPARTLWEVLHQAGRPTFIIVDSRAHSYLKDFDPSALRILRLASRSGRLKTLWLLGQIFLWGIVLGFRYSRHNTAAVVVFGGYSCLPAALGAILRRIPLIIHEQNAVAGLAIRLLAPFAAVRAVSFQETQGLKRVVWTGLPVRKAFWEARTSYHPPEPSGPFRLLVMGGSGGAKVFSSILPAVLAEISSGLRNRLEIVQQVQVGQESLLSEAYKLLGLKASLSSFIENPAIAMANTHLLICRAGATTLGEAMTVGRPVIAIPYPYATDNHQLLNARRLEMCGAVVCLQEDPKNDNSLKETLRQKLETYLQYPERLAPMAQAAYEIGRHDGAAALMKALQPFM